MSEDTEQLKARIKELEEKLNYATKDDGINHLHYENIHSEQIKVRLSDLVLKGLTWRNVYLHLD